MSLAQGVEVLLLLIGGFFGLVGSIGLVRLRGPMLRLHAPTKATTMGVGALLLAAMIHGAVLGEVTLREALILLFLFATAPVTALYLARVHLSRSTEDLPPGWPPKDAPKDGPPGE